MNQYVEATTAVIEMLTRITQGLPGDPLVAKAMLAEVASQDERDQLREEMWKADQAKEQQRRNQLTQAQLEAEQLARQQDIDQHNERANLVVGDEILNQLVGPHPESGSETDVELWKANRDSLQAIRIWIERGQPVCQEVSRITTGNERLGFKIPGGSSILWMLRRPWGLPNKVTGFCRPEGLPTTIKSRVAWLGKIPLDDKDPT